MNIPRSEYPRPQFVRPDWLCLNGEWEFEKDAGDSGLERGLRDRPLSERILVPFCPESSLSGIGDRDFLPAVWYRRRVTLPEVWKGRDVLLHFQAVDYDATVWVNGVEVRRHRGGFTPFSCPLAGVPGVEAGREIEIVVRARDPKSGPQPRGKQSWAYENAACHYTRTTGIWQTVWLEPVPKTYLLRTRISPDVGRGAFRIEQPIAGNPTGLGLRVVLSDTDGMVCEKRIAAGCDFCPALDLEIPDVRRRLWEPGNPFLYGLRVELLGPDGAVWDAFDSYAGLRSVAIDGKAVLINGRPVFQRLVLDQGYYPDGIMTAPDEASLVQDIELSLQVGFNGARLHQKVFEERFLYHADRMGYLVWGEFGDWGCSGQGSKWDHQQPGASYITEWLEALERDYSHPSIIGWCPLNETFQPRGDGIQKLDEVTRGMFLATKAMDLTRPVLDASGYSHRVPETDIYDSHDYDQNPATFAARYEAVERGEVFVNGKEENWSVPYGGQPYFVSEFGGIWWNPLAAKGEASWGYGERPKTLEEFYVRFEGLCSALLRNPAMFGYCYTQLTDVFQEQNGLFFFDRREKFDAARLRRVQQQGAAIEKRR